jgi:hypothetical protein
MKVDLAVHTSTRGAMRIHTIIGPSWILTRPADLPDARRAHLEEITAACRR